MNKHSYTITSFLKNHVKSACLQIGLLHNMFLNRTKDFSGKLAHPNTTGEEDNG